MAGSKETQKYKLTLSIDSALARKFAAFAGYTGEDMSAIASRAIRKELRGFTIRRAEVVDDQAGEPEASPVRIARPDDQREAG